MVDARSYLLAAFAVVAGVAGCGASSDYTVASVCGLYASAVTTQAPRPPVNSTPPGFPNDFFQQLARTAHTDCLNAAHALGLSSPNSRPASQARLSLAQAKELLHHMTDGTILRVSLGGTVIGGPPTTPVAAQPVTPGPSEPPVPREGLRGYRSDHPGRLPQAGHPIVGGVRLPAGRPAQGLPLWVSDREIPNAVTLAARLANKFPRTGLWPLLWGAGDRPGGYMDGPESITAIDHIDVKRVLTLRWRTNGLRALGAFPGLAAGKPHHQALNPFALFSNSPVERAIPGPYLLMLVPCRRPADILSLLGYEIAGPADGTFSAILRSWENRFGAYLVMLTADGRQALGVQSPPDNQTGLTKLAAEILAATGQQTPAIRSLSPISQMLHGSSTAADTFDPGLSLSPHAWGFLLGDN